MSGAEYYDHTTYPSNRLSGSSLAMRAELDSIEYGFHKLVSLSGNGNKLMKVNAGADGHAVSIISDDGSTVTVAGILAANSLTLVTALPVTQGGTGGGTASAARTALGLAIGTDVQAHSTVLDNTTGTFETADETKLDGIETGANVTDATNVTSAGALMDSELTSLSGVKSLTVPDSTTISAFGATLIDDAAASNARTTLGLVISTDVQAYDAGTAKTDVAQTFTAPQRPGSTTLTASTNVYTPDLTATNDQDFVLENAQANTLANPASITAGMVGQQGKINGKQNATGASTIAFGSYYVDKTNTAITFTAPTTLSNEFSWDYEIISTTKILLIPVRTDYAA
jgi:hypothetical protein